MKMKMKPTLFLILTLLLVINFVSKSPTFWLYLQFITERSYIILEIMKITFETFVQSKIGLDCTLVDNVSKFKVILLIFLKTIFEFLGISYDLTCVVTNKHLNFSFKLFYILPTQMDFNIVKIQILMFVVFFLLVIVSAYVEFVLGKNDMYYKVYVETLIVSLIWHAINFLLIFICAAILIIISTPDEISMRFFDFFNTYLEEIALMIKVPVRVLCRLIVDYLLTGNYCWFAASCKQASIIIIKGAFYFLALYFYLFAIVIIHTIFLKLSPLHAKLGIQFNELLQELDEDMKDTIVAFTNYKDAVLVYETNDLAELMLLLVIRTEQHKEMLWELHEISCNIIYIIFSSL